MLNGKPVRWRCRVCQKEYETPGPIVKCSRCEIYYVSEAVRIREDDDKEDSMALPELRNN